MNMDNRFSYPPSEAIQPSDVSSNIPLRSFNAGRPPYNMNANAASTSTPGGNHASTWNTSQMFFPPPTLLRPENFQHPSVSQLHQLNQSEPPPPMGFPPPTSSPGIRPPPGPAIHPPAGPGILPPLGPGIHPPPGPGIRPPPGPGIHAPPDTGIHLPPGCGIHQPPGPGIHLPPGPGIHPPPGPGIHPHPGPGIHPPPGSMMHPPPSPLMRPPPGPVMHLPSGPGIHPPPGPGIHSPFGPRIHPPPSPRIHSPLGLGLPQPTHCPPPATLHPSPNLSPILSPGPSPFTRPNHGSVSGGAQLSTQMHGHPEFSGTAANFFHEREKLMEPAMKRMPEDDMTIQRREDDTWVKQFLESKEKVISNDPKPQSNEISISDMKNALYSTAQLVSQLSTLCENLKLDIDNQKSWSHSYAKAIKMKQDIQSRMILLSDHSHLEKIQMKMSTIAKKRSRKRRARQRLAMEEQQREAEKTEKDIAIEKWRLKQIHAEEEKKKERELKLAADSVLCEVRKKLSDVKRMQNILKSLEKLRKLRKDAASRKGISTDPQSDENFNNILEELREVAKKWSGVYSAEERVLIVMLEGEQEEERKRDLEMRWQKERDKQLQKKRKIDAMLFGDDTPADPLMQPFRQYYTQAEHSLPALVQIRREWDVFLVPVDHPKGSAIPQGWVIPDAPSDQSWASALQSSECDDF